MNCPVCNVQLAMSERQGIEIDYCPKCRGVWLDRGELDKIIMRSNPEAAPGRSRGERDDEAYVGHHARYHEDKHDKGYYKKRKNFLLDLFD